MTGSRDIEGMFVFSVGRVMNAWFIVDILDALKRASPYFVGEFYYYFEGAPPLTLIEDL